MRMSLKFSVALLVLPAMASGASVLAVDPPQGVLGTSLTIVGTGFGAQPGKAWLMTESGQQFPLTITSWSDLAIGAVVHHGVAGELELIIDPQGPASPFVTPAVFTLEPPEPAAIQTAGNDGLAQPGEVVTLLGKFFGSDPGRVRVGERRAKVLYWTDSFVEFRVPHELASGAWDVRISTPLDDATLPEGLGVVGSAAKFGQPGVVVQAGDEPFKLKLQDDAGLNADGTLVVHGLWHVPGHSRRLQLQAPVEAAVPTEILVTSTSVGFTARYQETWGGTGTLRDEHGTETIEVSGSYVVKDLPP
jgi:hypothetical protein